MNLKPGMLSGTYYKEIVEVEHEGNKYEIEIKPLTHSQSSEIGTLMQEGIEITRGFKPEDDFSNVRLDTKKNLEAANKALLKACEYGTVDHAWNTNNIDVEWPAEWVKKVGNRVLVISGLGDPKEVERFRNERKGM